MTTNLDLEARCALAMYKILGAGATKELLKAQALAEQWGYVAYSSPRVSELIVHEPALMDAYNEGRRRRKVHEEPIAVEILRQTLEDFANDAAAGCGQFYELYADRFTIRVDGWLAGLSEVNRAQVEPLLESTDYIENPTGYWSYDQEEGDIEFVSYVDE